MLTAAWDAIGHESTFTLPHKLTSHLDRTQSTHAGLQDPHTPTWTSSGTNMRRGNYDGPGDGGDDGAAGDVRASLCLPPACARSKAYS